MCALRETKLKGKGEVIFGEEVGSKDWQGVWRGGRAGEENDGPVTEWVFPEVCSGMKGVIQAYVGR